MIPDTFWAPCLILPYNWRSSLNWAEKKKPSHWNKLFFLRYRRGILTDRTNPLGHMHDPNTNGPGKSGVNQRRGIERDLEEQTQVLCQPPNTLVGATEIRMISWKIVQNKKVLPTDFRGWLHKKPFHKEENTKKCKISQQNLHQHLQWNVEHRNTELSKTTE